MKRSRLVLAALAVLCLGAGTLALAQQNLVVPVVPTVGTTDLFADVVNGYPTAQTSFATAAQISGVPGYVYSVPLTAFSLTFGNSQSYMLLNPAGTLATGTFTMAPNPSDGQRACVFDTQIQTAVTFTANTGQTIVNAPTAEAAANWTACFTFVKSLSAWERSQ